MLALNLERVVSWGGRVVGGAGGREGPPESGNGHWMTVEQDTGCLS